MNMTFWIACELVNKFTSVWVREAGGKWKGREEKKTVRLAGQEGTEGSVWGPMDPLPRVLHAAAPRGIYS